MSRYIEKIVIPKSSLHTTRGVPGRGLVSVANRTSRDMGEILEDTSLKRDEKVKLYNQALHRLLTYDQQFLPTHPPLSPPGNLNVQQQQQQDTDPSPSPREEEEEEEEHIASTLPPTLRAKGRDLLRRLSPTLQWNDRGEILSPGKPILRTNITDLLHTAVRVSKKPKRWPEGWEYFRRRLKEANIPHILLGSGPQFDFTASEEEEEEKEEDGKMGWTGVWDRV